MQSYVATGKKDATGAEAHPDCGYSDMLATIIDSPDKTGQIPIRPDSGAFPWMNARGEAATEGHMCADDGVPTQVLLRGSAEVSWPWAEHGRCGLPSA